MKRRKPVDRETTRKQTEKAIFAFRKFVVIAGQQDWITEEQSSILNDSALRIDEIFMLAMPQPKVESESEAELPF